MKSFQELSRFNFCDISLAVHRYIPATPHFISNIDAPKDITFLASGTISSSKLRHAHISLSEALSKSLSYPSLSTIHSNSSKLGSNTSTYGNTCLNISFQSCFPASLLGSIAATSRLVINPNSFIFLYICIRSFALSL